MAFRNPPIAGSYLVRPAIQSPNYVLGSAGWTVNRDGTVEFNSGTFRGAITTILQPSLDTAQLQGNALTFFNQNSAPSSRAAVTGVSTATGSQLVIDSGRGNASNDAVLWLLDALNSPDGKSYVRAQQKATNTQGPVTGSVMQTDTDSSSNNSVHVATYSITTDASGNSTFNHGCRFTPAGGFLASVSIGGADFYEYTWLSASPFTLTQASAHFNDRLGNSKVSTTFTAIGIFIG